MLQVSQTILVLRSVTPKLATRYHTWMLLNQPASSHNLGPLDPWKSRPGSQHMFNHRPHIQFPFGHGLERLEHPSMIIYGNIMYYWSPKLFQVVFWLADWLWIPGRPQKRQVENGEHKNTQISKHTNLSQQEGLTRLSIQFEAKILQVPVASTAEKQCFNVWVCPRVQIPKLGTTRTKYGFVWRCLKTGYPTRYPLPFLV